MHATSMKPRPTMKPREATCDLSVPLETPSEKNP